MMEPQKLWEATRQVLGRVADLYGQIQPVPKERILTGYDGMTINLGDQIELQVLETLGHASHHFSFFEKRSQGLFPGDAAGIYVNAYDVIVPTTPPPFNLEVTLTSINRLIALKPKTLYYTHFGPTKKAVKKLEEYADQLKLWAKIVSDSLRKGENFDTLYKKIIGTDNSMKTAINHLQNNIIFREGVVRQDIQGFIEYLKKNPQNY